MSNSGLGLGNRKAQSGVRWMGKQAVMLHGGEGLAQKFLEGAGGTALDLEAA